MIPSRPGESDECIGTRAAGRASPIRATAGGLTVLILAAGRGALARESWPMSCLGQCAGRWADGAEDRHAARR